MKVGIISDTHGYHNELRLPPVDILFHAGDFTSSDHIELNKKETLEFLNWFSNQDAKYKIFIAGNHEFYLEELSKRKEIFSFMKENYPGLIYLENSSVKIEGFNIYGSPYCPVYSDHAFTEHEYYLEDIFKNIEDETNILITHTPAFGTLDLTAQFWRIGSEALKKRIESLKALDYHFHGHAHYSYGVKDNGFYVAVNASNSGNKLNEPIIMDI